MQFQKLSNGEGFTYAPKRKEFRLDDGACSAAGQRTNGPDNAAKALQLTLCVCEVFRACFCLVSSGQARLWQRGHVGAVLAQGAGLSRSAWSRRDFPLKQAFVCARPLCFCPVHGVRPQAGPPQSRIFGGHSSVCLTLVNSEQESCSSSLQ